MATSEEITLTIGMIVEAVKQLDGDDFTTVVTVVAKEMERRMKGKGKSNSAAKGVIPAQFQENYDWVDTVMQAAHQQGWEAFEMHTTKKDGTEEIIEMSEGVLNNEENVHQFSSGQKFTRKHAMVLSAKLKREDSELYQQFKASYVPRVEREDDAGAPKVVRMTAEEKEVEKATKAAEKEAEKERIKAEKEAEKARIKVEKDAEKAVEKARKDAEKVAEKAAKEAVEKAAKEAAKKVVVKAPIVVAKAPIRVAVKPAVAVAAKPAVAKPAAGKPVEWSCPVGSAKKWQWKGEWYIRDHEDFVWKCTDNNEMGDWCGKYDKINDAIDKTVEEPQD